MARGGTARMLRIDKAGGWVAGEESAGETSLILLVLTFSAIHEPATNVGAHRRPKVVQGERGMHLGVGKVV